ncbi:AGAP008812-PA [Anopheles gambiae str. PEST]|uniref:AGAP008812-PA n=1 Tax=Anopheles gambiae TaxID=7165 RepID=Q7Q841_ANOGA|nr:AGAP008812-PA [Anopheles gambiae str. PEST]
MATITTITKSGPGPAPAVPTTPQFKSHVYSKYRELLGSYNGKANEILQTYPAYRVREDTGFGLGGENYGGPPQSTIGNSARRIQAQLPAEPPACVQNAMMRRDKQPFTYTPGGIDLSQIKSPRMAKRISRNANSEGVTGQPKVSPLAQVMDGRLRNVFPTGPPAPPPPPPPTAGRVLPSNGGNRSIPPPPPPPGPAQPTASSSDARKSPRPQSFEPPPMGMRPEIRIPPNPMAALRKAPRPQPKNDFWIEEYRREKQQDERPQQIPRPVPPSYSYTNRDLDDEVAKNTFNRTDELTVRGDHPLAQHHHRSPSPSNLTVPHESGSRGSSSIKTPPVYGQSPVPANLPPPITPTKVAGKEQTAGIKAAAAPPPPPPPPHASSSSSSHKDTAQSSGVSPSVSSASSPGSPNQSPSSAKPTSTQRPAAQALGSLYIPPIHEVFANSKQSLLTQASPPWMSSRHNSLKEQPEWVHKDEQDSTTNTNATQSPEQSVEQEQSSKPPVSSTSGSPRAPSVAKESVAATSKPVDSIVTAPTAVSARQAVPTVTMPVNRGYPQQAPVYAQAQPVYSTQSPAGTQKVGENIQFRENCNKAVRERERIIPIQIEKSPVQAPVTAPTFAPPPYYSPSAQYGPASAQSSMQSPIAVGFATPHSGFTTPTAMFTNPNHFVNQGYNNISYPPTPTGQPHPHYQHHQHYAPPQTPPMHHPMHPQAQQQRMQQSTPTQQGQQVTNVRIVPIKVESGSDHTTVRGPLSNTPAIIQSDPRSSSNAQSWNGNNAPNQSRSFRVLQQITDTLDEAEAEKNAKEQSNNQSDQADGAKQQYSRSTAQQQDAAEGQLRRLQLSNEDKALMNRVKNQVDGEVYLHNEEDPRYRGAAIPSKAFRYLQNMTDSGQAANQSNNGSGNRAQQMFNKANYNDSDTQQSQQYVPPSEQKVEEPKKYTGGSIPSRSFKMLQAMTDAPGPGETDF